MRAGPLTIEQPVELTVTSAYLDNSVESVADGITVPATVENIGDSEETTTVTMVANGDKKIASPVAL